MAGQPVALRRSRRPLLATVALLLVSGVLSAAPASGHTFTKNDGNDSPGRLDIRSASVGHKTSKVVHTVRTYEGWTPKSLGNDSVIIVEIDKNFDNDFERCAFIFFAGGRLRGSLTNCRRTFIRQLSVSKPSKAVAKITIPTAETGEAYRWVVFSFWTGLPARCSDVCFDAAPNRPPPILHDLRPPVAKMSQTLIQTWEVSTTMTFSLPFEVSDAHSGIDHWTVQRRSLESPTDDWSTVLTGSTSGSVSPGILSTGGRYFYRVLATDKHGNQAISAMRFVYEASDVDELTGPGTFDPAATPVANVDAFGGDYVPLDDPGDSYEWTFVYPEDGFGRTIMFIGPGTGDWEVELFVNDVLRDTISASDLEDAQRQVIRFWSTSSDDETFRFELVSGAGFGIDAVLI